jgi:hypothetical protein
MQRPRHRAALLEGNSWQLRRPAGDRQVPKSQQDGGVDYCQQCAKSRTPPSFIDASTDRYYSVSIVVDHGLAAITVGIFLLDHGLAVV